MQSGDWRREEMQRCSIGVEMWRCRCAEVEWCRGAEVQRCRDLQRCAEMCRVVQRGYAEEMQHRCRDMEVQSAEVQSAECRVQRCRSAVVLRCRDAA